MIVRFRGLSHLIAVLLISILTAAPAIATPSGGRGQGNNPANRASDEPSSGEPDDDDRFIVKFREGTPDAKGLVRAFGGDVLLDLPKHNAMAARLPEQARQGLQNNPHVEYIEVDQRRYPMANPPWSNIPSGGEIVPYGIQMVQADQLTDAAVGNRKLCIIDSGYYRAHDDLQSVNVTASPDIGTGDPFVDNSSHGSHVAGTIAAIGGNGLGVRGVLPSQKINLHIVKVFGDDGVWAYSSTLVNALTQCRAAGANIVSMSLGGAGSSTTELNAFQDAYNNGVLSIAAAGNAGTSAFSYPASYGSVVSVAGVDLNEAKYTGSQFNSQVEIAAPAVAVLSTVTSQETNTISVNGVTYSGNVVEFAARSNGVTGPLVDGGFCAATGPWSGAVVLCQRGGGASFFQKVSNVQSSGGVAAVIYNNLDESLFATLGAGNSSSIPAIGLHQQDGLAILASGGVGSSATVVSKFQKPATYGYSSFNGTSMATPHVSGVAALVWSYNPSWTNAQIRAALQNSARDIGAAGRDDIFGFGIVQAKAARDYLCATTGQGCADPTTPPPTATADCFNQTSHGDFYTGDSVGVNVNALPGDVRLSSSGDPALDQQDITASSNGFSFNTTWFGQTFTPAVSGNLVRAELNLFCAGCPAAGTFPSIIVSVRATSGDLPTGPDLATATIPGFNSGASSWYAANFATPANLTAGTRYAIVARPAGPAQAPGVYAYIVAPTATPNTYPAGQRVTSATGVTWGAPVAGRDVNFKTHMAAAPPHFYASSGYVISSASDSVPPGINQVSWNTLNWSATTPPGTNVALQVAGSNSGSGPFLFVGPDGTSGSSFTSSGASLAQFDGNRYLKVKSMLTTSVPDATPVLHEVSFCYSTELPASAISLSDLVHRFDGTPKSATVTTTPAGLAYNITYDGSATAPSAIGSYAVVATLTDPLYQSATATGTLVIRDEDAPVISGASVDKTVLWPPNHLMHDVIVNWTATDNSGAEPTVTLSITSSDSSSGIGSGNTSSDWEIVTNRHVRLRAERAGTGPGRTYTITITATDAAGNSSSTSLTVTAPRNL